MAGQRREKERRVGPGEGPRYMGRARSLRPPYTRRKGSYAKAASGWRRAKKRPTGRCPSLGQEPSERLGKTVAAQERGVARIKVALSMGSQRLVELAATVGRLDAAWAALPGTLHSGNHEQALPAVDGHVRELIAAFRQLQASGSSDDERSSTLGEEEDDGRPTRDVGRKGRER